MAELCNLKQNGGKKKKKNFQENSGLTPKSDNSNWDFKMQSAGWFLLIPVKYLRLKYY